MFRVTSLFIVLAALSLQVQAQYGSASRPQTWQRQRHSVGIGVGMANFLGELGGRDQVGSNFIYDLEWSQTRPALHLNYRYQLASRVYVKSQFAFGIVAGSDALTAERFRRNRNLAFRSILYELSLSFEVDLLQFELNNRYNRTMNTGKNGYALYLSAGVGAVRFNPKANFRGDWYNLRDMSTEGQGLPNGPAQYNRIALVFPIGLGFRYQLSKEWAVGVEVTHRITQTDYMDDVSTVYYDNEVIAALKGELAAYFADPSLGYYLDENLNEIPLNSTQAGMQRGDPSDNDAYFFAMITARYRFTEFTGLKFKGRNFKRRSRRVLF